MYLFTATLGNEIVLEEQQEADIPIVQLKESPEKEKNVLSKFI